VGVPEGDTIFRAAAQLRAALVGKHLLVHFADGPVLHTHMQMAGAWHIYRPAERWRRPGHSARVVVRVDDGTNAVCFSATIVELRRERDGRDRPTRASRMLERIGPDLCESGVGVDLDAVLARLALLEPDTELATALLDQRVAAGIGNVFKSEICFAERIFPFTTIAELDDPTRRRIYETARHQLTSNLTTARRTTYGAGLAVYRRTGRRCPRCGTAIVSRRDRAARSTYWCPRCQSDGKMAGAREVPCSDE
jgi:endonuclease VIII